MLAQLAIYIGAGDLISDPYRFHSKPLTEDGLSPHLSSPRRRYFMYL